MAFVHSFSKTFTPAIQCWYHIHNPSIVWNHPTCATVLSYSWWKSCNVYIRPLIIFARPLVILWKFFYGAQCTWKYIWTWFVHMCWKNTTEYQYLQNWTNKTENIFHWFPQRPTPEFDNSLQDNAWNFTHKIPNHNNDLISIQKRMPRMIIKTKNQYKE